MPRRMYFFTPAIERRMREAWSLRKRERTAAIDAIVADTAISRPAVKQHAIRLGLCTERRTIWTAEEDRRLVMMLGNLSTKRIARELKRSVDSVASRADALKLSRAPREGYTRETLRNILGAPLHRIDEWIDRGWLGRQIDAESIPLRIADSSLIAFIYNHMDEIDFRMADQTFLKGVFSDDKTRQIAHEIIGGTARRGRPPGARTRRPPNDLQCVIPWPGVERGSAETHAGLGQENACRAASA